MQHPDKKIQKKQADFLSQCPESEREYHASIFRTGNAAIIYHQLANQNNDTVLKSYYEEWLEGLPSGIKEEMKKLGFEKCKSILSFTRYVNERNDIGMDEWMKEHLSEKDYAEYISNKSD